MYLNENLAKKQKITQEQRDNLEVIYNKMAELFTLAGASEKEDSCEDYVQQLKELEFKLQENWNFEKDELKHTWWNRIPGCTCPRMDNDERFGFEKIQSSDCKYHGFDVVETKTDKLPFNLD